jgi:hypothetical protein
MLNGNAHPQTSSRTYPARAALYAGAIALAAGVLATGWFRCPMAAILHLPCPACGSTRAALALMRLDFAEAFRFNPVAPIVIAALGLMAIRAVALVFVEGNASRLDEGVGRIFTRVMIIGTLVQVVVWIARFFGALGGPCPV